MRPALSLLAILALSAAAALAANPADWYHGSAHKYVAGRHQEALVQAEEGLRLFPDDPALKALAGHLRKLQDQKRQDQGQEGQSRSDQEGDQKKDQDGKAGEDGEKEDKDKQRAEEEKEKDKEGKEGEEKAEQPESDDGKGRDSTGEAMAPVKPGEMSKEDAERLLNSIQDDEKKEHKQQQRRHRKKVEVEQDW